MNCYGIISDTHHHAWSAFSRDVGGVNSRLQTILDQTARFALEVRTRDGHALFHGGDMFHVRGNIAPSVLNPSLDTYRAIAGRMGVYAIPGNHDLEGNDSHRVSNAVSAMESVNVRVAHAPEVIEVDDDWAVALFPWFYRVEDLIAGMQIVLAENKATYKIIDAIIHAPIDGVLPHLPPHGLDASVLGSLGYNRVFAGHYHHHRDMGNGVFSIGALTHQTWGDVGSKAGGLIVYRDRVEHIESTAPKFVELTGSEDPAELEGIVKGNYVRGKITITNDSELEEFRAALQQFEPAGVVIHPQKKVVAVTRAVSLKGTPTVEASIDEFCKTKSYGKEVTDRCIKILTDVRSIDD